MAITKKAKQDLVKAASQEINDSKEQLLVGYQGMSVEEIQELRAKMREEGVSMRVLKNTLLDIAMKDAKVEDLKAKDIKKPLALVTGGDEVAPAKLVVEYAKTNKNLELIAGAIDKKAVTIEQLTQLAAMPSRDVMIGTVVGTIAAPISSFVRVLAGTQRGLVNVLTAIRDAKS